MAIPTLGAMIAAIGSPAEWAAIATAKLVWDDSTSKLTITGTVQATTFSGALSGNVTGNCSGSSGSCTGNCAGSSGSCTGNCAGSSGSCTGNAENVVTPTAGYKHLGAWGVDRTAVGAILVNTAYMSDISGSCTGNAASASYCSGDCAGNAATSSSCWGNAGSASYCSGNCAGNAASASYCSGNCAGSSGSCTGVAAYASYVQTLSYGTSAKAQVDSGGNFYPSGNKTQNCGYPGGWSWSGVYSAGYTQGTSRLTKAKTVCPLCGKLFSRGTGTMITLGEEADYALTFCLDCKIVGIEELKHLPPAKLSSRREAPSIEFVGIRVQKMGGNSRQVFVDFTYGEDEELPDGKIRKKMNSTIMGEQELEDFLAMDEKNRVAWLHDVGQREWDSMEENILIDEGILALQMSLNSSTNHLKTKDIKEEFEKYK